MEDNLPFADLPVEIAKHICSLLTQYEVAQLSQISASIYCLVRPILYRHPKIHSYGSLICFQRTIAKATWMGKVNHVWSTRDCIDQTKTLDITVDPSRETRTHVSSPSAIMISRVLGNKLNFQLTFSSETEKLLCDVTLQFAHCRCDSPPVSVLKDEDFPRVTRLVLYVGHFDPEEPYLSSKCLPTTNFLAAFLNGYSFPDLNDLEVRHHWATIPPANASIDVGDRYDRHLGMTDILLCSDGIVKLESILLESPPGVNPMLLNQLLGNSKAVASNLTTLDLRFCNLDEPSVAQLLYHAPPRLKRLTLLIDLYSYRPEMQSNGSSRQFGPPAGSSHNTHLCPLIRQYSKRLERLDYGSTRVCHQLFWADDEILSLRENGIKTTTGGVVSSEDSNLNMLDVHAIEQTIQSVRQRRRMSDRESRIRAIMSSSPTSTEVSKARRDIEALLDEEEAQRHRLINGSRTKWVRRIIALDHMCENDTSWDEMKIAANMEEQGVHWVLADRSHRLASWHSSGELSVPLEYDQAIQENFKLDRG